MRWIILVIFCVIAQQSAYAQELPRHLAVVSCPKGFVLGVQDALKALPANTYSNESLHTKGPALRSFINDCVLMNGISPARQGE